MSSSQSNPIYQQHQRMADPASASSAARPAHLPSAAQKQQPTSDADDVYASYAQSPNTAASDYAQAHAGGQSIYGGIDSSAYSHHSHAGQRGPSSAATSTPPAAQLPPLPALPPSSPNKVHEQQTLPHMYPSSASQPSHVGGYGSSQPAYLPRDDSVDVSDSAMGYGDAASIHSRSHLNPIDHHNNSATGFGQNVPRGAQTLVARFQADQVRPSAVYTNEKVGNTTSQPTSASTGKMNEKERALPEGYKTPPSFSRASSAWGGTSKGNKHNGGNLNSGGSSPYGPLGGLASKSDPALQFAEGDYAKSKFARFWLMILSKNIVIRWLCFIVPVLALLWIPGEYSVSPNAMLICRDRADSNASHTSYPYVLRHLWFYYQSYADSLAGIAR